jgi:hypothetical protein
MKALALALLLASPAYAESSFPSGSASSNNEVHGLNGTITGSVINGYVQKNNTGNSVPSLNSHNGCGIGSCSVSITARPSGCGGPCYSVESRKAAAARAAKAKDCC